MNTQAQYSEEDLVAQAPDVSRRLRECFIRSWEAEIALRALSELTAALISAGAVESRRLPTPGECLEAARLYDELGEACIRYMEARGKR